MQIEDSFLSDMHVHATQGRKLPVGGMSIDSMMSVENIAQKAQKLGLHTLGVMEHIEPISGRHPWSEVLLIKQLVDQVKNKLTLKLLSGGEASIIDLHGNLSASHEDLQKADLDYVIASVHSIPSTPQSIDEYHSLTINMMKRALLHNPYIDIIGHPWRDSQKILKRFNIDTPWSYELIPEKDIAELAGLATSVGVALEISWPSLPRPGYSRFLRLAAAAGGVFTLGSDAHQWERFIRISEEGINSLRDSGINFHNLKVW